MKMMTWKSWKMMTGMRPAMSDEEVSGEVGLTDPGSIVWVCWGSRWYPAKVILLADVPEGIRNSLSRDTGRSVVVRFYGDEDYGRVDAKKMDTQ